MLLDTVSILDGNRFVVSNRRGDLEATPTDNHGLFRWRPQAWATGAPLLMLRALLRWGRMDAFGRARKAA